MLKMRRDFPVPGHNSPTVSQHINRMGAEIYHGFYGQHHAGHDLGCTFGSDIIWNFRRLMELAPNAMTDKLADHGKTVLFNMLLHGLRYIIYAIPRDCLRNPLIQGCTRNLKQGPTFRSHLPHRNAEAARVTSSKDRRSEATCPTGMLTAASP